MLRRLFFSRSKNTGKPRRLWVFFRHTYCIDLHVLCEHIYSIERVEPGPRMWKIAPILPTYFLMGPMMVAMTFILLPGWIVIRSSVPDTGYNYNIQYIKNVFNIFFSYFLIIFVKFVFWHFTALNKLWDQIF